ncbi:hypothetical protein ACJ6WE_02870 [Streptomyces sp. MMS24-I31]|uniref:hypothetical protein n=1 Tax=Streptomyces sp. MMS24-I31 TaxID=3351563 RepID=UPI0038968916
MTTPDFRPTHVVPQDGLPAWEAPDPARPTVPLDPLLPVRLVARRGDWAHIMCANGWSAWVDGRLLVTVPQGPPDHEDPPVRTADARPLLARADQALARYRAAVEELADGRLDGESFRGRTQGLRIGVVVDGESVWLYDSEHGRWEYADGSGLSTYAADAAPMTSQPAQPAQPAEPAEPAASAEGAAPAEPDGASESARPAESARPTDRTATRVVAPKGEP